MAIAALLETQTNSDIEMDDATISETTATTTEPSHESHDLKSEWLLVNSQINLLAWQNILREMVNVERPECKTGPNKQELNTEMNIYKLTSTVDAISKFGVTCYSEDLRPLAAVCFYSKEMRVERAYELPKHVLPMLRAHCHKLSTYRMQNMLMQVLEYGSDRITDNDDGSVCHLLYNASRNIFPPFVWRKICAGAVASVILVLYTIVCVIRRI